MKKPLITLILCIFSVIVFSQDIIYTVSGEIVNDKTSLDSILVENLSTGKRSLFGNLPAMEYYQINLTKNSFWGSVGIENNRLQVFSVAQNQPGLLSVAYFGNTPTETNVTVFNLNGQKILSTSNTVYPGNALQVRLTTQGVYFVQFDTPTESKTFKAVGALQAANFDVFVVGIHAEDDRNKSGILSETESTIFLPGDTIRVSVYKNGYYARPQGKKIDTSSALNFPFDVSAVLVSGTSDGYVELNMNSSDITAFDTLSGNVQINYTGEIPELKPGDIITVDLDTMGYLRKVVQTTTSENVVSVETEPAYMNEIFIDREVKLNTGLMNPGVQLKSNASLEEISAALTDENGYIHPVEVYYHTGKGQVITKSAFTTPVNETETVPLFDFTRDLKKDLYGKSGDNVHLYISKGYASLTANAVFEMDFNYKGELDADTKIKKGNLQYFTYYLEGNAGFQTSVALDLTKAFEKEDTKKLQTVGKVTAKFVVGPVPVWITFNADIYGNYKFEADASAHADFGFESTHNVKVGGTYIKESDSFTPIKTYTPVNKVYPLNLEGQVNASARLEVYPRAEVKFYGFFGPYAEIVPYVEGKYNAKAQSQITTGGVENFLAWNSNVDLGLDFRVGSELTFLWGLLDKEFGPTVLNGPVWSLWKSPTAVSLKSELPSESPAGSIIPLKLKVTDLLENPVLFCPVYLSGSGSFDHQIIFTDYNGEATAQWTISNNPGQNELIATIYNADKSIISQKSYVVNSIGIPTVTTTSITGITQTTATSGGNVTADGGASVTARGVCWNTAGNPTTADSKTSNGTGTGSFTGNLTGLTANTPYYVRAYAINSQGTAYGNQVAFTSGQSSTQPTVTTNTVTTITQTTAVSGGNITADGGAAVTARGVCWSTSPNPTTANNKTTNGTGTGSFTSNLTGLTANTKYYVRAYATNSQGTTYGNEIMFTSANGFETGTVTDTEGNVYKTVKIGNQWWMAENLKSTKLNDGTNILNVTDNSEWINLTSSAFCWYNNNPSYKNTHGALYNWFTVNTGKLAPEGWRVPTIEDWDILINYLGGSDIAGGKLKEAGLTNWNSQNVGATNESGFTAVPGGLRSYSNGLFWYGDVSINGRTNAHFWSSSEKNSLEAWGYDVDYNYANAYKDFDNKKTGFSVRCILGVSSSIPSVSSSTVINITQTTATGGGNVSADGGAVVTARGVCWSTSPNPTITNSKTTDGIGTGSFTSSLTGLTANTTYFVRAYATNSQGTAYGNELTFTTSAEEGPVFGSFTDPRDGRVYKTVTIGTQVWMAENLAYLPIVSPSTDGSASDPYYYVYGYNGSDVAAAKQQPNYTTYGVLYNWPAAMASCPTGWHLPTEAEWTALENYLIANSFNYDGTSTGNKIAKSMSAKTIWSAASSIGAIGNNLSINNNSGFSALPGGNRTSSLGFASLGNKGDWWSAIESSSGHAWFRELHFNYSNIFKHVFSQDLGYSVRCIKGEILSSLKTAEPFNITSTSAVSGGNVMSNGGAVVTARGICWNTSPNPTTANSKTSDGNGTGSFTSDLTGLAADTKYYVRAYATNSQGTAYGNEVTFTSAPVVDTENYFMVGSEKHTLNLGYNVWLSELDCGNFDVFAHCLYLTSNVEIKKYGDSDSGKNLLPSGIGKLLIFNMYNKNTELVPGEYIFVDEIGCTGEVIDGDRTFTMSSTDKFVASSGGAIDPTCYSTSVNLDIDWNIVDFDNPSSDVINKYTNYQNSMITIKDGSVTIEKSGDSYTITFDCTDSNGTHVTGKYTGNLNFVEFGI